MTHKPCLILNSDYQPLGIVNWKRAYCLSFQQNHNIEIVAFYKNDFIVGANNKKFDVPAVMRTKFFCNIYQYTVKFSRQNLFLRDNYICQYCNMQYDKSKLTYDHVIPKSKWDPRLGHATCWTNIVTACSRCNRKKADRTPQQAKMQLRTKPYAPKKTIRYLPVQRHLYNIKQEMPEEWTTYLMGIYA